MMNLKVGTKVRINLPKTLPGIVDTEFQWRDFLQKSDQQIVIIDDEADRLFTQHFGKDGKNAINPCIIVKGPTPPFPAKNGFTHLVLFLDWFQVVGEKTACDCSMSSILISGCKNKNHI